MQIKALLGLHLGEVLITVKTLQKTNNGFTNESTSGNPATPVQELPLGDLPPVGYYPPAAHAIYTPPVFSGVEINFRLWRILLLGVVVN